MKKIYTVLFSLLLSFSVKAQVIILQPDAAAGIDTYVSNVNDSINYGTDPYMYFGGCDWQSDTFNLYLKFDLTSVTPGTTIDTARVDIYMKGQNGSMSGYQYGVYEVLGPWAEDTLYWYNQPQNDTNILYSFTGDYFQLDYMQGWRSIYIPDTIVQNWVDNPATNNGIVIKALGGFYGYPNLSSSDWTDAYYHPRISINSNGTKISGTVTDNSTGNPLEGVIIKAFDSNSIFQYSADTSDAAGNYLLDVLYPDTFIVKVEGITGYLPETIDSVTVNEGLNFDLDVALLQEIHAVAGEQNGTWTLANSPYIITGDVIVPDFSELNIEPGVVVQFAGPFQLGVYGSFNAIGTSTDSIKFTNYDTIAGNKGRGLRFYEADSSWVEYCLIENMFSYDYIWGQEEYDQGGGIYSYSTNLIIQHNTIRRNYAQSGGGIFILSFNNAVACINRNRIEDNIAQYNGCSNDGGAGACIYAAGNYESVFFNENLVLNNEFFDDNKGNNEGGGGLYVAGGNYRIINNTFLFNKAFRGSAIYSPYFNGKILNNIFWFNSSLINNEQLALETNSMGSEFEASYNCIQDTGIIFQHDNIVSTDTVPGLGNIYMYPEFADTLAGNYWLGSNSPCIDTAYNHLLYSQYDFIDRCRIFDGDANGTGIVDMGAYEYNAHDMLYLDLGEDFSLCNETPVQLGVNNFWDNYSWNTGDSTNYIYIMDVAGTFYLTVSQTGCYAFDSVAATVYQLPVILLHPDTAFCGSFFDIDAGAGMASYLWNDSISGTNIFHATESGDYWAYVTSENNCSAYSDTLNLSIYPFPELNLPDTAIPLSSGSVLLDAGTGYADYHWSTGASTHLLVIFANYLGT
ncbi:MAG: DNRLRE domain-containing protein, partial [Bacteroidota bacterium]